MIGWEKLIGRNLNSNFILRIAVIVLIFFSLGVFIWISSLPKQASLSPSSSPASFKEKRTAVVVSPVPSVSSIPSPSIKPSPKISPRPSPNKPSYIIAAFGDSMVDTMGENLDYLDKSMMARYPTTKFKFYNYGIGSQNIVEANKRFADPFKFNTRDFPPINQINADIIVISSFAYNPLSPYDLRKYLDNLSEVIDKAKKTGAKVYLLTEIAPLRTGFGKGAGGVNWDDQKTKSHVELILSNLDNAVSLASETKTPLINAYQKSQVDGKYGNKVYVGTHDGIHPSIEGEVFMAEVIAQTIVLP